MLKVLKSNRRALLMHLEAEFSQIKLSGSSLAHTVPSWVATI